jgi:hypothetical protein
MGAILTKSPEPPAHAGPLWPAIKGLLEKDPAHRLTAERARPLLVSAAAAGSAPYRPAGPAERRFPWLPGRPRRRSFATQSVPPTVIAPPPTLAAATEHTPAADTAPHPVEPRTAPMAMPSALYQPALPSDFPGHLVELTVGGRTGYTVRVIVTDEAGEQRGTVFATVAGRLPLFSRPRQAIAFVATTSGHDIASLPSWSQLKTSMSEGRIPTMDEYRYDLDLPPANLAMHPRQWQHDVIVRAGDAACELIAALSIEGGEDLLGPGTALDQLDDLLRLAYVKPRRHCIDRWERLDRLRLAGLWQRAADLIASRADWPESVAAA